MQENEKKNLTKTVIEALKPPPFDEAGKSQRYYVRDEKTNHLCICVFSTGSKTWFWSGRFKTGFLRYKLGKYPDMTPKLARDEALKISAMVAQGIDPRQPKEMTFGQFFEREFMPKHMATKKEITRKWYQDYYDRLCKALKPRTLSSVDREDIRSLHDRIGKENGPYAANRVLQMLSSVYSYARERGFMSRENPCKGIRKFPEKARDRFLSADEVARFIEALNHEKPIFRDFLLLSLFTGVRKGNLLSMKWENVSFDEGVWRIPDNKSGEPIRITLGEDELAILHRRKAESDGSEWVFPSTRSYTGHLMYPRLAFASACRRAGLKDVVIHDLRHALGGWFASTGASMPIIGKALGHKCQQSTARYAHVHLDPVRAAKKIAIDAMLGRGKEPIDPPPSQ